MRNIKIIEKRFHLVLAVLSIFCLVLVAMMIGTPKLRLVGASEDSKGNSMAIIENNETGKQDVFDMNSNVFGVGRLQDIRHGAVSIRVRDNEEIVLKAGLGVPVPDAALDATMESKNPGEEFLMEDPTLAFQAAAERKNLGLPFE